MIKKFKNKLTTLKEILKDKIIEVRDLILKKQTNTKRIN